MARAPASEKTRNAMKDMLAGKTAVDKSSLVRRAARLIVEEALEKEAVDALGSGYYEHAADRRGYRNRYRTSRVKSAEGAIEFAVPQLAEMAQPFNSKIREVIRGRTEELERLAVESTREAFPCATSKPPSRRGRALPAGHSNRHG